MPPLSALSLLSLLIYTTSVVPTHASVIHGSRSTQPSVILDNATVIGYVNETTGTVQYLGIPFAQPPYVVLVADIIQRSLLIVQHPMYRVGALRLNLPQPVAPYTGTVNATTFGNQCIQQTLALPTLLPDMPPDIAEFIAPMATPLDIPQSEDCE